MKHTVLIAILAMVFSGCALIFKGDSARITFTSNPTQAEVFVDGSPIGQTTTQAVLKVNQSYTITFRKAGYADQTYVLSNRIGALWVVLDVLSGLVPVIIDASTGAWYEFDTNTVNVTLTPQTLKREPLPAWVRNTLKREGLKFQ
jgi:PEGA domain